MKLALCVATMRAESVNCIPPGDIVTWTTRSAEATTGLIDPFLPLYVRYNTEKDNLGVVGSYQWLYERVGDTADVLCFAHDDVIMREHGWNERVIREFEDESVGVVGFGGAKWHGTPDLYKVPYVLQDLRRGEYLSNVDDAEVHGERFTGSTSVAVLDGFAIAIRRGLLDRLGGFSFIDPAASFFCYDYAISAIARRLGFQSRVVGIRCHHRGGGTSVQAKTNGKAIEITSQDAYDRSHRWFYEEFRDVMPFRCK